MVHEEFKYLMLCIFVFVTFSCASNGGGQNHNPDLNDKKNEDKMMSNNDREASFPGGLDARLDFVSGNFKLPAEIKDIDATQGQTNIDFVVQVDGSITDIEVIHSFFVEFDEEAVRVIDLMSKWIPAQKNGEIVTEKIRMPFRWLKPGHDWIEVEK